MKYDKEISFGAFDSELMHQEITIPEGFEATIDGNKIILTRIESEDEKIRKRIIHALHGDVLDMEETNKALAWLEKQGEQKPTDKVEPKFNVGDWIINRTDATIMQIVNNIDFYESVEIGGQRRTDSYNYVEWDFRLWTIADAKDGDVLDANGAPFIYKKHSKDYVYFYCGVNLAGDFIEANGIDTWDSNNKVYPATKEQRDLLFAKMKEAGYEWVEETKELKKIMQKPAEWNEDSNSTISDLLDYFDEDKCLKHEVNDIVEWLKTIKPQQKEWGENEIKMLDNLITYLDGRKDLLEEIKSTYIDWLKSLKERYTWKPSEEQMKALHDMNLTGNISYAGQGQVLIGLYNDLKKLKGE